MRNYNRSNKLVLGVGTKGDFPAKVNGKKVPSYTAWWGMLKRCYSNEYIEKHPTYKNCFVCKEWLEYANFKEWYDNNYINGYALDKDIIIRGNKKYSPITCAYVPQEINKLLNMQPRKRGKYPIGVSYHVHKCRYEASCNVNKKRIFLGGYDNSIDAYNAYKQFKENRVHTMAREYYVAGKINERVYNALSSWVLDVK